MSRQAEVLQTRAMLSSVTFNPGFGELSVSLDGSDNASAALVSGQIEVSINGVVTGETPAEETVSSITITGGDGGTIDLSGLTGSFSALMMATPITTGSGADLISGSAVMDDINSGAGNDTVHGGGGVDYINGGADNDILHGDEGYGDSLFGGTGDDELWSGTGTTDSGTASLDGGPDTDTIDGRPEVDKPTEEVPETPEEEPDTSMGEEPDPDPPVEEEPDSPTEPVPDTPVESPIANTSLLNIDPEANGTEIGEREDLPDAETTDVIISAIDLDGGNDLILDATLANGANPAQLQWDGYTNSRNYQSKAFSGVDGKDNRDRDSEWRNVQSPRLRGFC